ncbi:MAG: hypothetical protein AAB803_00605 [Patescibacteria group bacterium]
MQASRHNQPHRRIFRTIEQKAQQRRPLLFRIADQLTAYFGTPRFFVCKYSAFPNVTPAQAEVQP